MATSLYARVALRGFPVFDASGQSGQGALQDSTAKPASAGLPTAGYTDPNTDPGSVPATLPAPEPYALTLGTPLWGLPGAPNPDNTPKPVPASHGTWWDPGQGHAAPFADPAQKRIGLADDLHGPEFTGMAARQPHSIGKMAQTRVQGSGSTADTLQPLTGQIRSQAGYDAVQGYGGGGPGPGGVNSVQGPTTDDMHFDGTSYHGAAFVNAAETPFLSPGGDQFIAVAPELPPFAGVYDVPTASVAAQAPIPSDVPATGPALAAAPALAGLPWG